jgi:hypothetical protein
MNSTRKSARRRVLVPIAIGAAVIATVVGSGTRADAATAAFGPRGAKMAALSPGECSRVNDTVGVKGIVLEPAAGYSSQSVRVQMWVYDHYLGTWRNTPWSGWQTAKPNGGGAVFNASMPVDNLIEVHRYTVVVRGAWYFDARTTLTTDMTIGEYYNYSWGVTNYGTTCYA